MHSGILTPNRHQPTSVHLPPIRSTNPTDSSAQCRAAGNVSRSRVASHRAAVDAECNLISNYQREISRRSRLAKLGRGEGKSSCRSNSEPTRESTREYWLTKAQSEGSDIARLCGVVEGTYLPRRTSQRRLTQALYAAQDAETTNKQPFYPFLSPPAGLGGTVHQKPTRTPSADVDKNAAKQAQHRPDASPPITEESDEAASHQSTDGLQAESVEPAQDRSRPSSNVAGDRTQDPTPRPRRWMPKPSRCVDAELEGGASVYAVLPSSPQLGLADLPQSPKSERENLERSGLVRGNSNCDFEIPTGSHEAEIEEEMVRKAGERTNSTRQQRKSANSTEIENRDDKASENGDEVGCSSATYSQRQLEREEKNQTSTGETAEEDLFQHLPPRPAYQDPPVFRSFANYGFEFLAGGFPGPAATTANRASENSEVSERKVAGENPGTENLQTPLSGKTEVVAVGRNLNGVASKRDGEVSTLPTDPQAGLEADEIPEEDDPFRELPPRPPYQDPPVFRGQLNYGFEWQRMQDRAEQQISEESRENDDSDG